MLPAMIMHGKISRNLTLQAFTHPDSLTELSLSEWDLLLRQARRADLLATLYRFLDERNLLERVPEPARRHFSWALAGAERHTLAVKYEVSLILQALQRSGIPVILLKGAAYVMAKLPAAGGRIFSDIDILVPKVCLNEAEAALMLHGWATTHHDAYDQHYYRAWMHELPPMQHMKRLTVIDVHHAILPDTAAIHPDPEKLRAAAIKLDGYDALFVLSPVDMVLHSACHLFHDSEFSHGLRDLLDIDALLRHFAATPGFWPDLIARAHELELMRPLFYALRYSALLLHTPIPPEIHAQLVKPPRLLLTLMDSLFTRALLPEHPSCADWLSGTARLLLYIRANWLRMPPFMLARHLFHKAFLSPKEE